MNYFIKNIHINKLFHLENIDIPIADEKYPHLIITGKNGSGKTVLLNALVDFIELLKVVDFNTNMLDWDDEYLEDYVEMATSHLQDSDDNPVARQKAAMDIKNINKIINCYDSFLGEVSITFNSVSDVNRKYQNGDFIIAFYRADRSIKMIEPDSPQKPQVNTDDIRKTSSDQFINFLVDLKFQELLSLSNNEQEKVNNIKMWFKNFENLLKEIFEDDNLTFRFEQEEKNYSFKISMGGQTFGFNEMSDGFKAVIHIVADLIMKMQNGGKISDVYQKEGLVLIDEIETHLHLKLQKIIMPLLTQVFPNIQFIVTTHSPFVLSSMPNAVAFDLEHREVLDDLTEYSYESLAEGYFGVKTQSSYAEMQLNTLKELLGKEVWTEADKVEIKQLKSDFEKIPETISPLIVGEFRQIVIQNAEKLKNL